MNIPLGDTNSVKWVDGGATYDLDYLVLNGATIWEKVIEFTATATYDPITKVVQYAISGDRVGELSKWSYQAVRQSDGLDTGQVFVLDGLTRNSGTLGVAEDGTWDVTFNGYIGDDVRGTQTATVTIATPFIEITSVEEIIPPTPVTTVVQSSQLMGYTNLFSIRAGSTGNTADSRGIDYHSMALLVKATCTTLGLDNDWLGMTFLFECDKNSNTYYTLDQNGMRFENSQPSWGTQLGSPKGKNAVSNQGCVYIRLLKYTGEGWYNRCADTSQDHDTSVLKNHLLAAKNYSANENSCVTAWKPAGTVTASGYFFGSQAGVGGGDTDFSKAWTVGRMLGLSTGIWGTTNMDSAYGSRASGNPRIGAEGTVGTIYSSTESNYIYWSQLFNGGFMVDDYVEFGTDPAHRAPWNYAQHIDINAGWLDTIPAKKGTIWKPMTLCGQAINGQSYTTYASGQGWSQVHKFADNPPQ